MSNAVENFMNKNMLTVEEKKKLNLKLANDSRNALIGAMGISYEEFDALVDKACELGREKIDEMDPVEIDNLLGKNAVCFINKHINVPIAKKIEYKRDYLKLLIEQREFEKGIDGATNTLEEQNKEFVGELNKLIEEMKNNSVPFTETLMQTINDPESDPKDVFVSKEMLKGIEYIDTLKFLVNKNNKRLIKTINNTKEFTRVKTKAMKIIDAHNFGEKIPYDLFEAKLMQLINSDEELKQLNETFKVKITLVIATRFYIEVSRTKNIDTFMKTAILYFKTYMLSIGSQASIDGSEEFQANIKKFILEASKTLK